MARPSKNDLTRRIKELEAENALLRLQKEAAERNAAPCPFPHYLSPVCPGPHYPTWPWPAITWTCDTRGQQTSNTFQVVQ